MNRAMNNIVDVLRASPNVKVEITSRDLVHLVDEIVARIRSEIEKTPDEEGFYTVKEVMDIYDIKDRSTLWRWDKRGYLPCEKSGAKVLYQKKLVHSILGNPK